LNFFESASGIKELADMDEEKMENFLEEFSLLEEEFDYILIDTGAGINKNVVSFLLAAHKIIVITTPEPTALTDAYGIIKVVSLEQKDKEIHLVVNRVTDFEEAKHVSQKLQYVSNQFLNKKIHNLGFIFDDLKVSKAVREQVPFSVMAPHCPASQCIRNIATKLLQKDVSNLENKVVNPVVYTESLPNRNNGLKGFFSKVVSFFSKNRAN
jgi:flagellar biosynthesis protein FlhG